MVIDPTAMLRGQSVLTYKPEYGARIGVLSRHAPGSEIKWFEISECYIFHIFNAHEDGDEIVLHGCRFPEFPQFVNFEKPLTEDDLDDGGKKSLPVAYRWRLDLKSGRTTESALDEMDSEFPRVNEQLIGSRTRYGYAVSGEWRGFLKYDFDNEKRQQHKLDKSCTAGEGVFVPRPDAKSEDDGWLLGFTHDRAENRSELRIVDCRDFNGAPVTRIPIPQRVPYGFHAVWLPGSVL